LERWWLPTFACAWTLGLAWGPSARGPAWLALVLGLAALTFLRDARARLWGLALAPALWLAGLSAAPSTAFVVHEVRGLARLEGEVVSTRHGASPAFDLVTLRGALVDQDRPLPTLRLRLRGVEPPPRGARVRLLARVRPVTRFWNPTPHPSWPEVDAPTAEGRVVGPVDVVDEGGFVWLERARAGLRDRLDRTLPVHAAAVARALLLGDGSAVEARERDALRGAGMAHLLAVSGLHVALLAAFVFWAFARLLRARVDDPARAAALATIPVVLGFALIAGGAPSVWRAATMATLAAGLRARRRRPNAVAVTSAAILGFAIAQPDQALRPAFLLSAAATAAIVSAQAHELPWRAAFVLSLRTTLATAPLVIWCFGELPVLGVVANVVLLPIATVLLVPLAFVHALAAGLGLESLSAPLFTTTLDALVGAAQLFTDAAPSASLPPPSVAQGWILAAATVALLATRTWRRALLVVGLAALALLAAELHLRHVAKPTGLLRLTQLDVGQGDGALLDLPNGEAMLIDAGGGRPDPGERALVPLLRARRRDALAVVVISHPHPDHFGGMHALLAELDAGRLRVGEVWDGGQAEAETPHGPAAALLRAFRRRGIPVRVPCGERLVGGAHVEVGWPCPRFDAGYDANDNSLVVRVRHGQRAFLFTGDVEALAEGALVQSELALHADVLKVPHHGSRTSSSEAFLGRVRPWVAVASQGRGNTYGHPHAEVVARFRTHAIPWLTTRELGGVVIETDGRGVSWWSARDETRVMVRSREEAASVASWKRPKT
ncbi:MAG: DNA internalization-related competence protein ComEC/Rec2, partial [Myxococcales bacterium]|nr:DNA internalization-related competence protein ComEC/Rec2 [Myxococcales bacterium]